MKIDLTKEETRKTAEATDNLNDRALILVLHESGCAMKNLLALKIKDVLLSHQGEAILFVNQKKIKIIESVQALSEWIGYHPLKDNLNAPLWIHLGARKYHEAIGFDSATKMLKKWAEKAGVKKKITVLSFRRSQLAVRDLTADEFQKIEELCRGHDRMADRARVVKLSYEGESVSEITKELGRCKPYLSKWIKRFNEEGVSGLNERSRPGNRKYTDEDNKFLIDTLSQRPADLGLPFNTWDISKLKRYLNSKGIGMGWITIWKRLKTNFIKK